MTGLASLRSVAALLLVLATIVFLIGINTERSLADEASEARPAGSTATTSDASSEEAAEEGAEGHEEGEEAEEASETILGIDPESTGAIAAAMTISLLLAAALWLWGTPAVLGAAVVFALLFTALDLREVAHQLGEGRSTLAVVALVAAALHGGVAVLAGLALSRRNSSVGASTAA